MFGTKTNLKVADDLTRLNANVLNLSNQIFWIFTVNDSCPSDCQNNSTCIDMISHIHCQCVEGFNGTRCENSKFYGF